jgi:Domain of Unknown Function (DUF1080)
MKVTLSIFVLLFAPAVAFSQWTPLLDKELSQWGKYLGYKLKTGYKGEIPKDANGTDISPIGYNKDEEGNFTVSLENGEPVLKVAGTTYGCVFTKQEFENYHFKLKVKWGEKTYEPRINKLKDTGIVYHSIGEAGADYWRAWMMGQELQIMEGHMGDYWNIAGSAIDIRAYIPEGTMNPIANEKQPLLSLGSGTGTPGFCLRSENYESPAGEWTTIELICWQDKSLHLVNGHVVMVLQNSRYPKNGNSIPLTKGKIQIQSEGAEVFYKDIMIKNLTTLPAEYNSIFK